MVNWASLGPRVTITREDGTSRVLPLERLDGGDYLDIAQSPDEGFPPPIFIGNDPSQRSDVRTRQQLLRDWRRGMGEDEYDETTGTSSFRYSMADTRYKNVLVCRPLPVRVGSSSTVDATLGGKIAYVGTGTARWFHYAPLATPKYYSTSTSQWVSLSGLTNGNGYFYARGPGGLYYIWDFGTKLSQSDDAITWNTVAITDIGAAFAAATALNGIAIHDHKLFTLTPTDATRTYALFQSANATTAPGSATWTQLGSLTLDVDEVINQLFVWKFPPQPERGGLFCLTNRRIMWYDDTADAASVTAWKEWHRWDIPYISTGYGHALPWPRTGDLYVMPHFSQDSLWQFTGTSIAQHGPNRRGGLPPTQHNRIIWSMANSELIVSWSYRAKGMGNTNRGHVLALNESEGWHHILDPLNTGIIGSAKDIVGGGLGPDSVLTVLSDGTVWEQELFESAELPQYAAVARSYDSTALTHDTAKMDLGNSTMYKALLYHEMNAKIPAGASVAVSYRLDDSDQTGSFTSLGTATSATAMPWRVGFPANTKARQIELRYTLTRGTAASATPIVHSGILHTTLLPPPRFNTVFRVDLRSEQYRNIAKTVRGYGLRSLRTFLRECHGQMLSFTIYHPADAITVARGQAAVTPIENASDSLGRYTFQVRNLETPASGS